MMTRTIQSRVAATAATAALSLITLAAASPSAAPARAAGAAPAASTIAHWQNWGGYVAVAPKGKKISGVSTTFIIPKAVPKHSVGSPRPYEAGVWVKAASKTAAPTYQLFWELYPAGPRLFASVKPGDKVLVTVVAPGDDPNAVDGKFHFFFSVESGLGATLKFTTYEKSGYPLKSAAASDQHSAEVITEVPTVQQGLKAPEAGALDMGTVHYTDADYAIEGDPMDHGLGQVHPVTQHKISARYSYVSWPYPVAWIIPTDSSASSPSYGTAWKTDSFKTNYSSRGW